MTKTRSKKGTKLRRRSLVGAYQKAIMTDLSVGVIIPSTLRSSQLKYLRQSIRSLLTQTQRAKISVVVVSAQKPTPSLKKEFPKVIFLTAPKKAGFGEMNDLGYSYFSDKRIDWLMLLNDDAWVDPYFFAQIALLEKKAKRSPAAYTPIIWEADNPNMIDVFGVEYFRSGYSKNNIDKKIHTTLATAGCIVLSMKFLKEFVGKYGFFFNPIYYFYLEDVDFTIRIRMIGGEIHKSDQLVVHHHGSVSSGGRMNTFNLYQTYRNTLWVMICCWPMKNILFHLPSILLLHVWLFIYSTARCGPLMYFKIWKETLQSFSKLLGYRKKTVGAYLETISFEDLLSPYTFRTYHNRVIPG